MDCWIDPNKADTYRKEHGDLYTYARANVPAPATGASPRMGFHGINKFGDIVSYFEDCFKKEGSSDWGCDRYDESQHPMEVKAEDMENEQCCMAHKMSRIQLNTEVKKKDKNIYHKMKIINRLKKNENTINILKQRMTPKQSLFYSLTIMSLVLKNL